MAYEPTYGFWGYHSAGKPYPEIQPIGASPTVKSRSTVLGSFLIWTHLGLRRCQKVLDDPFWLATSLENSGVEEPCTLQVGVSRAITQQDQDDSVNLLVTNKLKETAPCTTSSI